MKRKKAIETILLAGGATVVGFSGYEWFILTRNPDKDYLISKKSLLEDLAETIIPATDTPGAREAGAVEFMLPMLNECTDIKTLNRFVRGLQDLEEYTQSHYKQEFSACSPAEKEAILQWAEQKSWVSNSLLDKIKSKFTGRPFFEMLKTYTVYGYCISEKGASLGMRYMPVPGKYLPCIPLEPNQTSWATK
jgi:Gluconate 2-dehydrogenase subunit 3